MTFVFQWAFLKNYIMKKFLTILCLVFITTALSGCSDMGYYLQCAKGQMEVMSESRPIPVVIADPQTTPEIRQKLERVLLVRDFAVTELGLPDNDSYHSYADIGRPYVVWNVVAAAEFSLQPKQWCFPVAGCVSYRGYFKQKDAETLASDLRAENYDVDLYGVQAYSTLSWFNDPVLSTFISSSDARLAGLIFHELAHQMIYIDGDTPFNEAFAMTVQIEGVRRWFQQRGHLEEWQKFVEHQERGEIFQSYLQKIHNQLDTLYHQDIPIKQMRTEKHRLISRAIADFAELKSSGQLDHRFDRWMSRGLNNARLAGIATYRGLVPGFQKVLQQCRGDFGCFYTQVKKLGKLPRVERLSQLNHHL